MPLLLLDVDGVLCPFGQGMPGSTQYPGFEFSTEAMVYASSTNSARLKRLQKSFDIHWCTGWSDEANRLIAPLHGLPELPVVPLRISGSVLLQEHPSIHWKFEAIERYVKDQPYAFVDDEITPLGEAYARERTAQGIPTLWIPTQCSEGLTDEIVDTLEEFARNL